MFTALEFLAPSPRLRELIILLQIGKNPRISQGRLASAARIAPSMVNQYIKDFTARNLLITGGTNRKNMTYHLTDEGNRYLNHLLYLFTEETLKLHKDTRNEYCQRLQAFYNDGIREVVFYGSTDFAQMTLYAAEEVGLKVIGVVDGDTSRHGQLFAGRTIASPDRIKEISPDAVLIASLAHRESIYQSISHLEREDIRIIRI